MTRVHNIVAALAVVLPAALSPPVRAENSASQPASVWLTDLDDAYAQAQQHRRPVFVKVGADWCHWCRKLDAQIRKPAVREALERWTLVSLDMDKHGEDVRKLGVGPIPALRLLTASGTVVATRDGFIEAKELVAWLNASHERAAASVSDDLVGAEAPEPEAVNGLVQKLGARQSAIREAAIRRLLPHPQAAAPAVAEAFTKPGLAVRLAALELLDEWGAPVADLDPWRPDTITDPAKQALATWVREGARPPSTRPAGPTPEALAAVGREIDRLARATSESEARAIRERLARYGSDLLPEVYARLQHATSDLERRRLTALRYRLLATDALVLNWPSGIERLSAIDAEVRHQAVQELAGRADPANAPLLLELFSDPDPLVREISLGALHAVGGADATEAMARLLNDPEPNVRAAVLKQMSEKPPAAFLEKVKNYVQNEADPDLVVHAVRVLRSGKPDTAAGSLMPLLDHASWRVRAEAAEALGKIARTCRGPSESIKADIYAALVKRLDDEDGFVVSRAVQGLGNADLAVAVEPLANAAARHPELASAVVKVLAGGTRMRTKAVPHLRRFAAHDEPAVRAAAITGLCTVEVSDLETLLGAALEDDEAVVRVDAANAFFKLMESRRARHDDRVRRAAQRNPRKPPGLFARVVGALSGQAPAASQPAAATPATQSAPAPLEDWVDQFRRGEGEPAWRMSMVPRLEAMLSAESVQERGTAAVTLVALGRDDLALPTLRKIAQGKSEHANLITRALPWLPWEQRSEVFRMRIEGRNANLGAAVEALAERRDDRAALLLWDLTRHPALGPENVRDIHDALQSIYIGEDHRHQPKRAPRSRRKQAAAHAQERVGSGPEAQRLIALSILAAVEPAAAAEAARAMINGGPIEETLRREAWQIFLLIAKKSDARAAAVKILAEPDIETRKLGLIYLAQGAEALSGLRSGRLELHLDYELHAHFSVRSGTPIVPEAPKQLEPGPLAPLLTDRDPEIAAYAGYLLALLGDDRGLDRLVDHWRRHAGKYSPWARLVYRAVSALGDESRIELLEEIYRGYESDDYQLREFYWTIRSMEGSKVSKFRRRIRKEVGMQNLR